jgi:hypothetical protein
MPDATSLQLGDGTGRPWWQYALLLGVPAIAVLALLRSRAGTGQTSPALTSNTAVALSSLQQQVLELRGYEGQLADGLNQTIGAGFDSVNGNVLHEGAALQDVNAAYGIQAQERANQLQLLLSQLFARFGGGPMPQQFTDLFQWTPPTAPAGGSEHGIFFGPVGPGA